MRGPPCSIPAWTPALPATRIWVAFPCPAFTTAAMGLAQTGFSQFQAALEAFEAAMHVANETSDKLLELQVCVGLGALFCLLRCLLCVFLRA